MKYVLESKFEIDAYEVWERMANIIADATSTSDLYVLTEVEK